jgi:hypothetical protein
MTDHPSSQGTALSVPLLRAAAGQAPAAVLALLAGPVGTAVAQAAGYAGQALSANTRRAYASDWKAFSAWCEAGGVPALPAPAATRIRPCRSAARGGMISHALSSPLTKSAWLDSVASG